MLMKWSDGHTSGNKLTKMGTIRGLGTLLVSSTGVITGIRLGVQVIIVVAC